MSVKVMGLVWDLDNDQVQPNEKYVLLAYADHADHQGFNIFPSVELIAKKTGYSVRAVQLITKALNAKGIMVKDGHGPRGTNKWLIPIKDGAIVGVQSLHPAGVQSLHPGGEIATGEGVNPSSPESSEASEPSEEEGEEEIVTPLDAAISVVCAEGGKLSTYLQSRLHAHLAGATYRTVDLGDKLVITIGGIPEHDASWMDDRYRVSLEHAMLGQLNKVVTLIFEDAQDVEDQADAHRV